MRTRNWVSPNHRRPERLGIVIGWHCRLQWFIIAKHIEVIAGLLVAPLVNQFTDHLRSSVPGRFSARQFFRRQIQVDRQGQSLCSRLTNDQVCQG
jgi:hypothetical protein